MLLWVVGFGGDGAFEWCFDWVALRFVRLIGAVLVTYCSDGTDILMGYERISRG